jgi:heptosyltransferase I
MRVLLVKMSSLGDVVHALPALTEAARALGPDVTFDWVVEEAFAAIPARHPAVAEVLPIAWRRWRRSPGSSSRELVAFIRRLRRDRYDLVLDAQGLLKSAAVTALAKGGLRAGFSRDSAREGVAALSYHRPIAVPRGGHAVDRLRRLFAGALGYPLPEGVPCFGIAPGEVEQVARPRCLLLHGATWGSKLWPVPFWSALAERAAAAGFEVLVAWGSDAELARARQIADRGPARLLQRMSLDAMIDEIGRAALVVGVDSGLAHLAGALDVPTVAIYGSTSSSLTGARGSRVRNLQAGFPCAPCLARTCAYRGEAPRWQQSPVVPACYAMLPPEHVWQAAEELVRADRVLHL